LARASQFSSTSTCMREAMAAHFCSVISAVCVKCTGFASPQCCLSARWAWLGHLPCNCKAWSGHPLCNCKVWSGHPLCNCKAWSGTSALYL
jgi:hypothetical protein